MRCARHNNLSREAKRHSKDETGQDRAQLGEILKLILKLLYKCPLMRGRITVKPFAIEFSVASTAQKRPIRHSLLAAEDSCHGRKNDQGRRLW